MWRIRSFIARIAAYADPFFKAAERATILGALKVAAFDLPATRGDPLIIATWWLGLAVLVAWIIEAMWNAATGLPRATPPAFLSDRMANVITAIITGLVLTAITAGFAVTVAAVINAIAAAATK